MSTSVDCYIFVYTHVIIDGKPRRLPNPKWYILGSKSDEAYVCQVQYMKSCFKSSEPGKFIYSVKDIGLDPKMCLAYYNQLERLKYLEHESYDWDRMCPHYTPGMTTIRTYTESVEQIIEAAVRHRHDTWTRRRHLMALFVQQFRS